MMPAELAARITAASAARADFERQRRAFARGDGQPVEWADWAVRLGQLLGQLLEIAAVPAARPAGSTGVGPDGWAAVAPADVPVIARALAEAATCHDRHGGDPSAVPAYRRLGRALGDDRD